MSVDRPNHVKFCSGETSVGFSFGPVTTVTPVHFSGLGHTPHLECRFAGGARVSLTPQTLIDLIREGERALAKLPVWPDIHDACGGPE
jgi:hypothetical protein